MVIKTTNQLFSVVFTFFPYLIQKTTEVMIFLLFREMLPCSSISTKDRKTFKEIMHYHSMTHMERRCTIIIIYCLSFIRQYMIIIDEFKSIFSTLLCTVDHMPVCKIRIPDLIINSVRHTCLV